MDAQDFVKIIPKKRSQTSSVINKDTVDISQKSSVDETGGCATYWYENNVSQNWMKYSSYGNAEYDSPTLLLASCSINVQCPHDCSVKGLLLAILSKVDILIGTRYEHLAVKDRASIDNLILAVLHSLYVSFLVNAA